MKLRQRLPWARKGALEDILVRGELLMAKSGLSRFFDYGVGGLLNLSLAVADRAFGRERLAAVYRNVKHGERSPVGPFGSILVPTFRFLNKSHRVNAFVHRSARRRGKTVYTRASLDWVTNSIFDMPKVRVDRSRQKTINVLVPAFSFDSMSAGFFGVFHTALMIARNGYHTRLVLFDNFNFSRDEFQEKLQKYPGLESLLDEVELAYMGDRYLPLNVSPHDSAVATVWYSAYFAKKIMAAIGGKPFLYLIQDYEAAFYPFGAMYAFADASYNFDYHALISTKPLFEFMRKHAGHLSTTPVRKAIHFNNACSAKLPDRATFMQNHKGLIRRVAFYSRPAVNRNMFELGARALITAWSRGVFETGQNWEFYGIGIGEVEIYFDDRSKMVQLPRMSLAQYEEKIQQFDICLSLMASPHPSITPFDLAGVGALVVTNTFATKTERYFESLSKNILATPPDVDSVANAIQQAVKRVDDLESRYENAALMTYPRDWQDVWTEDHNSFIRDLFGPTVTESEVVRRPAIASERNVANLR